MSGTIITEVRVWWRTSLLHLRTLLTNPFFRQISDTFLTRVLGIALGFGASVIISRILGPEGRGQFATAVCLGAIGVQFGNLGLPAANTYFVSRDRRKLSAAVGNSLLVSFVLGSFGAAAALSVFTTFPELAPVQGTLLWLGLLSVPLGLCLLLMQNLLLAIQEIRAFNQQELSHKILALVMMLCLVPLGWVSPQSVIAVGLITSVIVSAYALAVVVRRLERQRPRLSLPELRDSLHYGLRAYWATLFAFLVIRSDLLMVHTLGGSRQSGLYSIAATFADLMLILPIVVGSLLFPRLSQLTDRRAQWKLTTQTLYGLIPIMLLGLSVCFLAADLLIQFAYGRPFVPATIAVLWLLPGVLAMSVNTIIMNCFAAQGMPPVTVYSPALALTVNVLLNLWLIPHYGIRGAAISSSISYGLMLVMSVCYILGHPSSRGH